jgi:hypothetical protein
MPPPEAENWRERRRVERSARQARQTEEPEDAMVEPIAVAEPTRPLPIEEAIADAPSSATEAAATDASGTDNANKKRRRRGGRRRRRPGVAADANGSPEPVSDTDTEPDALPVMSTPESATASLHSATDSGDPQPKASD